MMQNDFDIAALVDDLRPSKPVKTGAMLALSGMIMCAALIAVIAIAGARADLIAGVPGPMLLIRTGILALLGFGTAVSVLAMAKPSVGRSHSGWKTAIAAAMIFPVGGVIAAATGDTAYASAPVTAGMECLFYSLVGGSAIAVPMVLALRKGAPVSPPRAGWLVGVAAGGLGALAYNFHCPFDSLTYIGLYYTVAVGVCAGLGRLIVPGLIRW